MDSRGRPRPAYGVLRAHMRAARRRGAAAGWSRGSLARGGVSSAGRSA